MGCSRSGAAMPSSLRARTEVVVIGGTRAPVTMPLTVGEACSASRRTRTITTPRLERVSGTRVVRTSASAEAADHCVPPPRNSAIRARDNRDGVSDMCVRTGVDECGSLADRFADRSQHSNSSFDLAGLCALPANATPEWQKQGNWSRRAPTSSRAASPDQRPDQAHGGARRPARETRRPGSESRTDAPESELA